MSKKLDSEQQKDLRKKAKDKLDSLEKTLEDNEKIQILDEFKNKFNICETVYKVVLKAHQESKGNKVKESELKLTMKQVPHALKFAGYNFDKTLLNELFGAESEKGNTVKSLRDAVTHGINEEALNEIIARKTELFGYMDEFIETIRTFDNQN